ncbi:PREDICTED: uncharacterized protein LOC104776522 [Camelina sativa]|uniref:Uncharacterized protein LOC104776522 n=1 Tax=Camelina sativa TaxID=90675 RepID=A0ABM0YCF8_CAMSA|nr:PREDICTED: uncharacterized protein LOC104776522 [Camelina sativa]
MAITPLRITNPFPSLRLIPAGKFNASRLFTVRATDVESTEETQPDPETTQSESGTDPDQFESRLSNIRLRYRSGTGKKAEVRKSKKGSSSGSPSKGTGMYLPPVSLKEAVSGGLKVELGFSPYSERINGRIAGLGLMALLLVELATGKSVLNYHTPSVVFLQIYFVAAVSAMFVKVQKEKVSVWPKD